MRRISYCTSIFARGAGADLGQRHRQDAVAQVGLDAVAGDCVGELEGAGEGAMAALDLVIVTRRPRGRYWPRPSDGQPILLDRELDLLAYQTGDFCGDDVAMAVS